MEKIVFIAAWAGILLGFLLVASWACASTTRNGLVVMQAGRAACCVSAMFRWLHSQC